MIDAIKTLIEAALDNPDTSRAELARLNAALAGLNNPRILPADADDYDDNDYDDDYDDDYGDDEPETTEVVAVLVAGTVITPALAQLLWSDVNMQSFVTEAGLYTEVIDTRIEDATITFTVEGTPAPATTTLPTVLGTVTVNLAGGAAPALAAVETTDTAQSLDFAVRFAVINGDNITPATLAAATTQVVDSIANSFAGVKAVVKAAQVVDQATTEVVFSAPFTGQGATALLNNMVAFRGELVLAGQRVRATGSAVEPAARAQARAAAYDLPEDDGDDEYGDYYTY